MEDPLGQSDERPLSADIVEKLVVVRVCGS